MLWVIMGAIILYLYVFAPMVVHVQNHAGFISVPARQGLILLFLLLVYRV